MLATLQIEAIGFASATYAARKAWVAEVRSGVRGRLSYDFLRYTRDYGRMRTVSRGIYRHYVLESDKVYEVCAPLSWRKSDRYFCRVTEAGDIERITREDVNAWLSQSGDDPSA